LDGAVYFTNLQVRESALTGAKTNKKHRIFPLQLPLQHRVINGALAE